MKVIVAGGSGLLGGHLTSALAGERHEVVILTRRPHRSRTSGVREVAWSPSEPAAEARPAWHAEVDGADAIVNLAGAGIADKRWTEERKQLIRSSRVEPTRALADAVRRAATAPPVFIQGSGINYYGSTLSDRVHDESSPPGDDYLGRTCVAWESEALPVREAGTRLVFVRTCPVLTPRGGLLQEMGRPFRFFVGGPIAGGRQYMTWIHVDDWIRLVTWAMVSPSVSGPINAGSPNPVTNAGFSRELGRALHRPSWAPVPAFALKLLFGEMGEALLIRGLNAVPARALELGFTFEHPSLREALDDVLG